MAVIAGEQICIPVSTEKADQIISRMIGLLRDRYYHKVSRRGFLRQWGKLRKALFLTGDYQRLRARIMARSNNVCEKCREAAMAHVHHIKPIAWHPRGALLDDNCMALCRKCHRDEHRKG